MTKAPFRSSLQESELWRCAGMRRRGQAGRRWRAAPGWGSVWGVRTAGRL